MKSGIELFLCSALEDEPLRTKLEKHLQTFRRYDLINALWHSQNIVPGAEVDQELSKHLKNSQMIVLLISPSFLSDDNCYKIMGQAMDYYQKGRAHLIPVILRPVHWKDAPFGKLTVLPANEKPITSWSNIDAALYDVADGIRQAIESRAGKASSQLPSTRKTSRTVLAPRSPNFSLAYTLLEHLGPVASVAFSPDGALLISDSWDNTIKVWNADARLTLYTLKGHEGTVYSVVFSPDMTTIVSGSDDCTVKVWEAQTGRKLQILTGHTGPVSSVALSNKIIVSGSDDCTVKVWEAQTGRKLQILTGHTGPVSSVALSADSKLLVSGSYDKTIKVWDRVTRRVLQTLWGHTGLISSIALSPDNKILVSGSYDKTIKVWDITAGQLLEELTGHTEAVLSVAFHPNGTAIASGSLDKTIKIWQRPLADTEGVENVNIAIVGSTGSGKNLYLTALAHRMHKAGASQTEESIPFTENVADATGLLTYKLVVGSHRHINVNIFNTAGEDLDSLYNRYIRHADGIIFLLDPLQISSVREGLTRSNHLPPVNLPTEDVRAYPECVIANLRQFFEQEFPLRARQKVKVPIAFTLSKVDTLLPFLDSGSILLQPSEHLGALNLVEVETINTEISCYLSAWTHNALMDQIRLNFASYNFFGVSSLGIPSDDHNSLRAINPLRVEDPLLWILYKLGLIQRRKSKTKQSSSELNVGNRPIIESENAK